MLVRRFARTSSLKPIAYDSSPIPINQAHEGANGYSTQHVAELLVSESRIRDYVRRDLLALSVRAMVISFFCKMWCFSAQQGLTDAAISVRQSNRALTNLNLMVRLNSQ